MFGTPIDTSKFLEHVLALPSTEIGPHEKVTVKAIPLKTEFIARQLVIPSTLASSFGLSDIQVAGKSQIVKLSGSALPAVMFTELCSPSVEFPPCPAGREIELHVVNLTDKPQTFQGCFIGTIPKTPSN